MVEATYEATLERAGRVIRRVALDLFQPQAGLMNWRQSAGVAIEIAGRPPGEGKIDPGAGDEFAEYARRLWPVVMETAHLKAVGAPPRPILLSREEWIATTSQSIAPLVELVLGELAGEDRRIGSRFKRVSGTIVSSELGIVLGYIATRVLGQYDVDLLNKDARPPQLFMIYPNIVATEERLGVDSAAFRQWLTLHELTHALEFRANEWLANYLNSLIMEHIGYLKSRIGRSGSDSDSDNPWHIFRMMFSGSMSRLMSAQENPVLAKTQALMSILEGYSEFIMDRAAAQVIGPRHNVAELFESGRAQRGVLQKVFERIIGLHMKVEQYKLGFDFISVVDEAHGLELVNRVWTGPESIPTLTELEQPELWIDRMLRSG